MDAIVSYSVSLVLGSGGARGLAHIGVINALEEHGFKIASLSGCSMGALIAGVYAAGKLDVFTDWAKKITQVDIVRLLDLSWGADGLVKGDKIIDTLKCMIDDIVIEQLPLAYTAVATDILNGKEVWIQQGALFDAIRASISLPLFFTPVTKHNQLLIDGGVLNPVPIAPTFNDVTDLTIAVNLGAQSQITLEQLPAIAPKSGVKSGSFDRFFDYLTTSKSSDMEPKLSAFDVADKAFDAMQGAIARAKLAAYPPDISIEIARENCGTLEFHRAEEMIALGYQKAKDAIEQFNKTQ